MPELVTGSEGTVVIVDRGIGDVPSTRDVTDSNARTRIGLAALEPALAASIEHRVVDARKQLLLGHDLTTIFLRVEVRPPRLRLAALGRPSFCSPFLEPAVEDCDTLRPEMTKHEPATRRSPQWRVVIDDDAVAASHAERLHCRAELLRPRQHVRRGMLPIAQRVDVEKARARNVTEA